MQRKLIAAPAVAGLVALPIAGYTAFHLMKDRPFGFGHEGGIAEIPAAKPAAKAPPAQPKQESSPAAGEAQGVRLDVLRCERGVHPVSPGWCGTWHGFLLPLRLARPWCVFECL